jgi:hypothetical protein
MVEAKVFEKIRKVLIADATIKGYVEDRVYTAHISSIESPKYPAISLFLLPGQARKDVIAMVEMNLQIDLWFDSGKHTIDDAMECCGRIRELLHRQPLSDASIGVKVISIEESMVGPIMYDADIPGHHLPVRFRAVAI